MTKSMVIAALLAVAAGLPAYGQNNTLVAPELASLRRASFWIRTTDVDR